MAVSRSLLWLTTPIWTQPAGPAIKRPEIHVLQNLIPKRNASLVWTVPWIPRGLRSRRIAGKQLQVVSIEVNDAHGEVEAFHQNESSGEEDGEVPISEAGSERKPPKPKRRGRGRGRKNSAEVTTSSHLTQKENVEETSVGELPKRRSLGNSLQSSLQEVAEDPSSESGVVRRDFGDAGTDQERAFPSYSGGVAELRIEGSNVSEGTGGVVTAFSRTEETEQNPEAPRKNRRRSRRAKEVVTIRNGTVNGVSDVDTEAKPEGRTSAEEDRTSDGGTSTGLLLRTEGHFAAESTSSDGAEAEGNGNDGEESGRLESIKGRLVIDLEERQTCTNSEVEYSPGNGVDVAAAENLVKHGSDPSEGEDQSANDGQESSKSRKRGRRSKTLGTQERMTGSSKQREAVVGNGAVVLDSLELQPEIPALADDIGEAIGADSGGPEKPVRKPRRRRQRRKRHSNSLQIESETEQVVPRADDVLESIIWCTVHLNVQAELEQNERLFVVGANPELGGWDLSLALPLPESDEEGICENVLKIPRGTMLEYKYFIESRDADSTIIERSFGLEIQYFLPWKEGQGSESEVVRDTWIPDVPTKLPVLSWGDRWWEEIVSVENSENGGEELAKNSADLGVPKRKEFGRKKQPVDPVQVVSMEDDAFGPATRRVESPIEQPEVDEWLKKKIRKKVFPREEPWLLESMIMEQRNCSARRKTEDSEVNGEGIEGGMESLEAEQKEPAVQVEILINSPQCTMQRMAILEDGKLVELLLEPVNTRVQVGNVYLGVVRQLLPGMTGVFVDIGGFQSALLDITRNQYPFTFPSIGQSADVPGDGQSWSSLEDEDASDWEGTESEEEDEDDGDFADEDEEGEDGEFDEEEVEDDAARGRNIRSKVPGHEGKVEEKEAKDTHAESKWRNGHPLVKTDSGSPGPITVNFGRKLKKWRRLQEGMQIIVQVKKEALGKKGPRLTAFPSLAGRFWVLIPGGNAVGVSRRITGPERKRLRKLAEDLLPPNFALTVRTEALGHHSEELEKDLIRLMETWKEVLERASAAAVAVEHGMEGAVPVLLHRAMGQFLRVVRDFFNDKVCRMVIDSPQCYQEVTSYLQEVAPQLSDRVELYSSNIPIFDAFGIEPEIEKFSSRRVSLPNGGYLVMEETEALVAIDVNGGTGVLSHDISQEEAILGVNLAAARQIAIELRLRDIGGIIVVDFIDMEEPKNEKLVFDEMRKAISRDRSSPALSEISEFGLMQMTRKRVRPSVTLTISDSCSHCAGVGRVEAHETTFSKIERAVRRLLATRPRNTISLDSVKWPQLILRVDTVMGEYLKGRKRKRMTQLSAALKVWLNLKVALEFNVGQFQVIEQHRAGSEKRPNVPGQTKPSQQSIGPVLLGKRGVWPGKRRRNFANQVSSKES